VEIAGEQRLVEAVDRFQLGGAGGGQGDIAIDKVAGRFGKQHKNNEGGQQQHRQRLQQRLRMKFLMTFSHQPPVNPAAGDLLNDFHIRQAAGQAVVDIRFKAGDAGAAGGKNVAIAEKDHRRIVAST
jgi:hypothetical protein